MMYDNPNFIERSEHYKSLEEKNMLKAHDWRTYGFWACVAVIGIVQALNSQGVNLGDVSIILSVLGFLEHFFQGNSNLNNPQN